MISIVFGIIGLGQAEEVPLFRLVGVYDSSSVLGVSDGIEQRFLWHPSKQMLDSCGPTKSPDAA